MTGPGLRAELRQTTIADVLIEFRQRWPEGFSHSDKPNAVSFLNFRLKNQIPNAVTRKRLINSWLTRVYELIEKRGTYYG